VLAEGLTTPNRKETACYEMLHMASCLYSFFSIKMDLKNQAVRMWTGINLEQEWVLGNRFKSTIFIILEGIS